MVKRLAFLLIAAVAGCGEDAIIPGTSEVTGSATPATEPGAGESPPGQTSERPAEKAPAAVPGKVRFIAMGDTGTGTSDQLKVGNTISAFCASRGCDFVQLLGDNIYDSGVDSVDDPLWQSAFEVPYAAIDLPFFAVLGNHDYGHNGLGTHFSKGQFEIDYTAKSKKWKMPSAFYHHVPTGGLVEVFALDTNMAMFNRIDDQKRDIAAWIGASRAPWKIAVGHHPYKSNGSHGNAGDYDGIWIPPANGRWVKSYLEGTICGKVDLYLAGHDHSRQWLNESCQGTELAVSGAGAKATELGGTNPALFQSLELGFLYIVVEEKTLTAEFIDDSGKTEFTHVIKKP